MDLGNHVLTTANLDKVHLTHITKKSLTKIIMRIKKKKKFTLKTGINIHADKIVDVINFTESSQCKKEQLIKVSHFCVL